MMEPAAADYEWESVVIGADIDAVRFAYENCYHLIKNREPYHHSYEDGDIEQEWAEKSYKLYDKTLMPIAGKATGIRVFPDERLLKVHTGFGSYTVRYQKLHLYDDKNVEGASLDRQLLYYRVIDWFDCQGLYDLGFDQITTEHKFVNKIKFFKTLRIDGDQKYMDLLCESHLSEEQLKSFDFSDTMVRFKTIDMLKERGVDNPRMSLWKRDIYPVYQ